MRGIIAGRRVELLDHDLEPATLGESRLDFRQVRLRERIGAGQHADSGGLGHRLETDIDHGLAGDACGRDRAVEDVARKRLANDRSSADRVVGRDLRGPYVVGRRGGAGAAARDDKHEDLVVLDELLGRGHRLRGGRSMLVDQSEFASIDATRRVEVLHGHLDVVTPGRPDEREWAS